MSRYGVESAKDPNYIARPHRADAINTVRRSMADGRGEVRAGTARWAGGPGATLQNHRPRATLRPRNVPESMPARRASHPRRARVRRPSSWLRRDRRRRRSRRRRRPGRRHSGCGPPGFPSGRTASPSAWPSSSRLPSRCPQPTERRLFRRQVPTPGQSRRRKLAGQSEIGWPRLADERRAATARPPMPSAQVPAGSACPMPAGPPRANRASIRPPCPCRRRPWRAKAWPRHRPARS